ncbi:MAG: hypothetical protein PCFJNLEI_02399 [Verrucomicrobiae bacterium]|nr:hypothetical protein [Verrucomicrobiae bacterium]
MSKRIDLVTDFNGVTVVWVDDRVLLSDNESRTIADSDWGRQHKVTPADVVSINNVWTDAVRRNAVDELGETISQNFAAAAIALIGVCRELCCNLSLVDFRTAHEECFGQHNTLFLLDLQNLTWPLGFMLVNGANIDSPWDWGLYGAHCVKHYDLAKSRYRFLSRFRTDKADAVSQLLSIHFEDYAEVELWSLRHDLPAPLTKHFREFVQKYLIHDDPQVVDMLLWFVDLPLTTDAAANHRSLGTGEALMRVRKRLGNSFNPESAKALFQGGDGWSCKPIPEYAISVSDLKATCEALKFSVEAVS